MKDAKVITISGSLRFQREQMEEALRLELAGNCVLTVIYPVSGDKDSITEEEARIMGEMHYQRIRMCDALYVVNKDNYIGESTKKEIDYAKSLGKEIIYMEDINEK